MQLLFIGLAAAAFVLGSGVTIVPLSFGLFVAVVTVVSFLLRAGGVRLGTLLLVAGSSALLALIAAEIGGRLLLKDALYVRAHDRLFEYSPEYRGRFRYTPDVRIVRQSIGDLAAMSGDRELESPRSEIFITDRRGLRNSAERSTRLVDLVVLGDSYGAGIGVSQELGWAERLGSSLDIVVYNLSLPGSPADEVLTAVTELPRLRLSPGAILVWMIFSGNDLDEPYDALRFLPVPEQLSGVDALWTRVRNLQLRSPLSRIAQSLTAPREQKVGRVSVPSIGDMLVFNSFRAMADRSAEELKTLPAWPHLLRSLDYMRTLAAQYHLPVLLVTVPTKEEVYLFRDRLVNGSAFAAAVREPCMERGFRCVDLTPVLMKAVYETGTEAPALLWWRDDSHWNEKGHAVAAAAIAEVVRSNR